MMVFKFQTLLTYMSMKCILLKNINLIYKQKFNKILNEQKNINNWWKWFYGITCCR